MSYGERVKRDGPAGFWRLDEESGSTLSDETTNGNDATITGAPDLTASTFLSSGSGISYLGVPSNYAESPSSSSLKVHTSGQFTLEAWVKRDTSSFNDGDGNIVFQKKSSDGAGDGSLEYMFIAGGGNTRGGGNFYSVTNDSLHFINAGDELFVDGVLSLSGSWNHVVVVVDTTITSDNVEFFVNGQSVKVGSLSINTTDRGMSLFHGSHFNSSGESDYIAVDPIDEPAIYNYALTPQQIRRHYWAGQGYVGYALEVLASGATAYWRMEEDSGDLIDETGNGYTATPEGSPSYGLSSGIKTGKYINFDGSDDAFDAGSNLPLSGNSKVTVEAWIKPVDDGESNHILSLGSNRDEIQGPWIRWQDNAIGLNTFSGGSTYGIQGAGSLVGDGNWHHLVMVLQENDYKSTRMWIDADEKSLSDIDGASDDRPITDRLTIARDADSEFSAFFNGGLDEVAVYTRELDDSEVFRHYELGLAENSYRIEAISSLPIAYWKLDETSGSTATDETANANNASYVGSPKLGDTALITQNKAVTLGAAGDRIEFPALGIFDGSQAFSVEGRVSADDLTGNPSVFNAWAERAVMLQLNNSGNSELEATASVGGSAVSIASGSLSTGTAYYVALTYDPTDGWALYLDGDLIGTDGTTGTIDTKSLTSNTIGEASDGTQTFLGTVDEWAVYDRALTQAEIIRHYYVGLLGPVLATILLLEGVVTDESDGSALDATIRAYRWSDGALLQTTTSDPSTGEYRIEEVEDTDLLVVMQPPSGLRPLAHGPVKPAEVQVSSLA